MEKLLSNICKRFALDLHASLFSLVGRVGEVLFGVNGNVVSQATDVNIETSGPGIREYIWMFISIIIFLLLFIGLIFLFIRLLVKFGTHKYLPFFSLELILKPVKTLVIYLQKRSKNYKIWIKDENPILFLTGYNFDFLLGKPYNKNDYECMKYFNNLLEENKNLILNYYITILPDSEHINILFGKNGIEKKYKNRVKFRLLKDIMGTNIKKEVIGEKLFNSYVDFYDNLYKTHIIVNYSIKNNIKSFYSIMVEYEHLPKRQVVENFDFYDDIYNYKNASKYINLINFIEENNEIYKDIEINLSNVKELNYV